MSLTGLLGGKELTGSILEVKKAIESVAPTKDMFELLRPDEHQHVPSIQEDSWGILDIDRVAFREKDYNMLVKYNLENVYDAGLLGTAFDYGARIIIGKKTDTKEACIKNTIAERMMKSLYSKLHGIDARDLYSKFEMEMSSIENYLTMERVDYNSIVGSCIYLAKLERLARNPRILFESTYSDIDHMLSGYIDNEVNKEILNLFEVFGQSCHMLINKDSEVVYNPKFGEASILVGGADADIWVDGTLWDFKTTKSYRFNSLDAKQLIGYYLLHRVDAETKGIGDLANGNKEITRVGFYKARFGVCEVLDLNKYSKNKLDSAVERIKAVGMQGK